MDEGFVKRGEIRSVVEGILSGERKQNRFGGEVSIGDFIEFFSAPPLHGQDCTESYPEPDSIKVMVRVSEIRPAAPPFPQFVVWEAAVRISPPDDGRSDRQIRRSILEAVNAFESGSGMLVPDAVIAEVVGVSLQAAQDHLEMLERDDRVMTEVDSNGYAARMTAAGRLSLNRPRRADGKPMKAVPSPVPVEIQASLAEFRRDFPDESKVAFVMMRFTDRQPHTKIMDAIVSTSDRHSIRAIRADSRQYHESLFYNILTYMHGCSFGIAVLERIETNEFNPNVSLEIGYMMALKRQVCLLKDRTLPALHADLVGHLYRPFDPHDPLGTIPSELEKWLKDRGIIP